MVEQKEITLEELLVETEQKITDNEYYEDVTVEYKNFIVHVRIKPISQADFVKISQNKKTMQTAEFNSKIIQKCVLNKKDNSHFTLEQINKLFTGGLASILALECCKVSGIFSDKTEFKELLDF